MRLADARQLLTLLGEDVLDRIEALDGLVVGLCQAELCYGRHWLQLISNRDFALLNAMRRVFGQQGGVVYNTQNDLVKIALERYPRAKRLLILEYDHEFPEDCYRKHAGYEQDVVGGLYVLRDVEEPLPVVYMWDEKREKVLLPNAVQLNQMLTERGLYPVDIVPMGCTSISLDLLRRWPEEHPWFSSGANRVGAAVTSDVYFCRMAQDHGLIESAWVDTSLRVQHYVPVPLDDSLFVKWYSLDGWKIMARRQGVSEEEIQKEEEALRQKRKEALNGVYS